MSDEIYVEGSVPSDMRRIFLQLKTEFSDYELWVRKENFGRTVSAAVLNKARGVSVTIPVSKPSFTRTRELESIEIGRIRHHLERGSDDLAMP